MFEIRKGRKMKKDLVQIIRDNPGCVATIDNDCWWIRPAPPKPLDEMSDDELDAYNDAPSIASDGDVQPLGDGGYGSGSSYGGDILQALAIIVGIKIESV
jgi:hypothetical protein